jgi:hypothetical protein
MIMDMDLEIVTGMNRDTDKNMARDMDMVTDKGNFQGHRH